MMVYIYILGLGPCGQHTEPQIKRCSMHHYKPHYLPTANASIHSYYFLFYCCLNSLFEWSRIESSRDFDTHIDDSVVYVWHLSRRAVSLKSVTARSSKVDITHRSAAEMLFSQSKGAVSTIYEPWPDICDMHRLHVYFRLSRDPPAKYLTNVVERRQ